MPKRNIAVIKLGGHAMDVSDLLAAFLQDVSILRSQGTQIVIVHGGGPHINALLKALGIESSFINGLRVTNLPTLEAAEMALCGKVNKFITRELQKLGVPAIGICGEDGGLLRAAIKDPALGRVGAIMQVNPRILTTLLEADFLPVIAPVALDAECEPLNVNADTAAGAIAGALQADFFALISDVPGVLDASGKLLPELDNAQIADLLQKGVISGGMIPKIECCLSALQQGCKRAIILDGRKKNGFSRYIAHGEHLGTVVSTGG